MNIAFYVVVAHVFVGGLHFEVDDKKGFRRDFECERFMKQESSRLKGAAADRVTEMTGLPEEEATIHLQCDLRKFKAK